MLTHIDDVKPGMVLGRDLKHNGMVLLKQGTLVTDKTIQTLVRRKVASVDIVSGNSAAQNVLAQDGSDDSVSNDEEYAREKDELEALFANCTHDTQMSVLKYCMLRQLQERYRDRS